MDKGIFTALSGGLAKSRELAAGADLDGLKAKAAGSRHLMRLVDLIADDRVRLGADHPAHPAIEPILDEPDREPGAFAERLAAGLSLEEASALIGLRIAEKVDSRFWGRLADFGEVADLLAPLRGELLALDQQLAGQIKVGDLAWYRDGRPLIRLPGGGQLIVSGDNYATLATAAAALTRLRLIEAA